jgi:hypothetical protein
MLASTAKQDLSSHHRSSQEVGLASQGQIVCANQHDLAKHHAKTMHSSSTNMHGSSSMLCIRPDYAKTSLTLSHTPHTQMVINQALAVTAGAMQNTARSLLRCKKVASWAGSQARRPGQLHAHPVSNNVGFFLHACKQI